MTDRIMCGTKSCESDAIFRAFWPGKAPINLCHFCKGRAESISNAMGFYLHVEPLPVLTEKSWDDS